MIGASGKKRGFSPMVTTRDVKQTSTEEWPQDLLDAPIIVSVSWPQACETHTINKKLSCQPTTF
jgi:hypothetical protein